jgi:DNA-binding transcriptional regulator YdaS (Cro superfamily)
MQHVDDGLRHALETAGGTHELSRLLGISPKAIEQWHRVPAERVLELENATGVRREVLRPDLYRRCDGCGE